MRIEGGVLYYLKLENSQSLIRHITRSFQDVLEGTDSLKTVSKC
jgi:hypothetical protein